MGVTTVHPAKMRCSGKTSREEGSTCSSDNQSLYEESESYEQLLASNSALVSDYRALEAKVTELMRAHAQTTATDSHFRSVSERLLVLGQLLRSEREGKTSSPGSPPSIYEATATVIREVEALLDIKRTLIQVRPAGENSC